MTVGLGLSFTAEAEVTHAEDGIETIDDVEAQED